MRNITRVGVDLAKNLIQVHAVDAAGKVVTNRALKREKFLVWCADLPAGCLVAMEACTGAHHWCRQLRERGFDARMIPAQFVAPYRIQGKSGKNDANDAAAVCEAASRPHMNFVPHKTLDQQGNEYAMVDSTIVWAHHRGGTRIRRATARDAAGLNPPGKDKARTGRARHFNHCSHQ